MKKGVWTGNVTRAVVGVGGAINTHHEGSLDSRPTERSARIDEFTPPPQKRKSIADFFRERLEKEAVEREANDKGERE